MSYQTHVSADVKTETQTLKLLIDHCQKKN